MSARDSRGAAARACGVVGLVSLVLSASPAGAQCGYPSAIGGSGGASRGVDVAGGYAFAVEHGRLTAFDLVDPAAPRAVGTVLLSSNFLWDAKVSNGIAACADAFWGVRLVDVREPAAMHYLATLDTPYAPESVAISGNIVYAADGQYSVRVIDITNPSAPFERASITVYHSGYFYAQEVVVEGSMLYVGSEAYGAVALDVVDVANPSAPVIRGSLVLTPGYPVGAGDLAVSGTLVYLTDTSTGLHVIDCANPTSPVEIGSLLGAAGVVKPFGSHLLLGRASTLDVIDVQVPSAPVVVGSVAVAGVDDIAIFGSSALLATSNAGLVTLDLSIPTAPVVVATSRTPDQATDVACASGLAFVADGTAGLKVMDLANPIAPTPIGQLDTPGTATGITLVGSTAYVADGSAGLRIIDVSTPSAPVSLGALDTPGTAVEVAVSGGVAYVADGAQGLRIVDVSNPTTPASLGSLLFPGVNAFATSVFVAGNLAYLTDTYYGLRIVDVGNPASPFLRSTTDTFSYANDVIVSGSYAFVADYSKRVYVMNVSNPSAPIVLWSGPQNSSGQKLALVGNRLYLSQGQGGYFETYDVSNPAAPVQLTTVGAPTLGAGLAHDNGILVVAHGSNGLRTFRADGLPFASGPTSLGSCVGSDVTLHVAAAGQFATGAPSLGYQWRRNGVGVSNGPTGSGSSIAGATSGALTILGSTAADSGTYDCLVTNTCGSVAGDAAVLTVGGAGCIATYCTPKTGLSCGTPSIAFTGAPSAAATSGFVIRAAPALAWKLGILIYGNQGRAGLPFQGGWLCLAGPRRSSTVQSGGTATQCDGVFALDMNAFARGQAGGNPDPFLLAVGTVVDTQWWGRDTGATGSFLSDGLEYVVAP